MKPGPLEIALIIVVIIVVVIIARIARGGRIAREASTPRDVPAVSGGTSTGKIWSYVSRTGIAMVVVGFLALVTAVSFFRWVLQSYLWGVIAIAIGLLLVFLSRKKR